jgi:hypothetical protein
MAERAFIGVPTNMWPFIINVSQENMVKNDFLVGCDTSAADILEDVKESQPELTDVSEDWDW